MLQSLRSLFLWFVYEGECRRNVFKRDSAEDGYALSHLDCFLCVFYSRFFSINNTSLLISTEVGNLDSTGDKRIFEQKAASLNSEVVCHNEARTLFLPKSGKL